MLDILARLRIDAAQLTLASLIQERALAAQEIENLRMQVEKLQRRDVGAQDALAHSAKGSPRPAIGHPIDRTQVEPRRLGLNPSTRYFDTNALLRLEDVCQLVGISRSTIYKRVSDRTFPSPIRISERSVRWRMTDLTEWSDAGRRQLSCPAH